MQDNTQLEVVNPLNGLGWLCMKVKSNQHLESEWRLQSFDVWVGQRQLGWTTLTSRYVI